MATQSRFYFASFGCFLALLTATGNGASLGHPGVSTKGGSPSQTKWNIICDPAYATNGSITTDYSPNATLSEVDPYPNTAYMLTEVAVELTDPTGAVTFADFFPDATGAIKINLAPYLTSNYKEVGAAQVSFNIQTDPLTGLPNPLPQPNSDGDDNTYSLTFGQAAGSTDQIGTFTDLMVPWPTKTGFSQPGYDFYSVFDPTLDEVTTYSTNPNPTFTAQDSAGSPGPTDPFMYTPPSGFTTNTIRLKLGQAAPVPLPPAVASGGLLFAGVILHRLLRRKSLNGAV